MRDWVKSVDLILLLFNGKKTRFQQATIESLQLLEGIFSPSFWENTARFVLTIQSFTCTEFFLLNILLSSAFTFWPHDIRSVRQREKNRNLTEERQHRAWNEQYRDDLKVSIEIPSVFVDPVLPVFDNETSKDIEAGEWEAFARETNKLWTLAKEREDKPFECSGSKCNSPSDYFDGVPVISGGKTGKHIDFLFF